MKTNFIILLNLFLLLAIGVSGLAQNNDFSLVKDRVVAELMKSKVDDSEVKSILSEMKKDGSFKEINYLVFSYQHFGRNRVQGCPRIVPNEGAQC